MRAGRAVVLLAAAGFAGWVFYSLVQSEPVHVTQSRLHRESGEVFVEGAVKNSGPDTGVDIEVHYYDNSGRALGEDRVAIKELRRGAVAQFETPHRVLSGVSQFSLYVNHGRNPYGN